MITENGKIRLRIFCVFDKKTFIQDKINPDSLMTDKSGILICALFRNSDAQSGITLQ